MNKPQKLRIYTIGIEAGLGRKEAYSLLTTIVDNEAYLIHISYDLEHTAHQLLSIILHERAKKRREGLLQQGFQNLVAQMDKIQNVKVSNKPDTNKPFYDHYYNKNKKGYKR